MILVFFILIFGAMAVTFLVAYVDWMVKTWRSGRKGRFWGQIAALAMAGLVVGAGALNVIRDFKLESPNGFLRPSFAWTPPPMADLTGRPFSFGKKLYGYDSDRGFNGDGYSIVVFELTPEMAQYFSAPAPEFFANYPKKSPDPRYKAQAWHTGPARADEQALIDFALAEHAPKMQARLDKAFESIRRSLAKPTTYYAYSYLMNGTVVSDIDFYLIDSEEQRLYIIDSHT